MNPILERIFQTSVVEDQEGNLINPFPTSLTYDRALPLYNLIKNRKAARTLEVGLAYGISTLFMCQAHFDNGGGRHTAIDPFQHDRYKSIGLLNIRRAGLDPFLRFYQAPSCEILPRLLQDKECFDCIFIDGSHLFDDACVDFYYADKLIGPGGFIMLDDLWLPAVRKVCVFALRNRMYTLAPEFLCAPVPPLHRLRWFWKYVCQAPLDMYSHYFSAYLIAKGFLGFCILQKVAEDKRPWGHYKSF